jgi:hypothetical protein
MPSFENCMNAIVVVGALARRDRVTVGLLVTDAPLLICMLAVMIPVFMVQVPVLTASALPAISTAKYFMVVVAETEMGLVYTVDAAEGTVPSAV